MTQDVFQEKQRIRERIRRKRRRLSRQDVAEASSRITDRLLAVPEVDRARTVHCYVSWKNEADTHDLIRILLKQGHRVVVPIIDVATKTLRHSEVRDFRELKAGTYGILEPAPEHIRPTALQDIDVIIVPGVAFDLTGHRIGFGGGYYDAFLATTGALKIALAYQFQIVDKIPTREEDQRVDIIVTEENVHRPPKA